MARWGMVVAMLVGTSLGCSDTHLAEVNRLSGNPGEITCYSGGQIIYQGHSRGTISAALLSYHFQDETGAIIRVNGQCVVRIAPDPAQP